MIQVELDTWLFEKNDVCGTLTEPSKIKSFFQYYSWKLQICKWKVWNLAFLVKYWSIFMLMLLYMHSEGEVYLWNPLIFCRSFQLILLSMYFSHGVFSARFSINHNSDKCLQQVWIYYFLSVFFKERKNLFVVAFSVLTIQIICQKTWHFCTAFLL